LKYGSGTIDMGSRVSARIESNGVVGELGDAAHKIHTERRTLGESE
jgi:hypothetical protein